MKATIFSLGNKFHVCLSPFLKVRDVKAAHAASRPAGEHTHGRVTGATADPACRPCAGAVRGGPAARWQRELDRAGTRRLPAAPAQAHVCPQSQRHRPQVALTFEPGWSVGGPHGLLSSGSGEARGLTRGRPSPDRPRPCQLTRLAGLALQPHFAPELPSAMEGTSVPKPLTKSATW